MTRYRQEALAADLPMPLVNAHAAVDLAQGEGVVRIACRSAYHKDQVDDPEHMRRLHALLRATWGRDFAVETTSERGDYVDHKTLRDDVKQRPLVQQLINEFDAQFVDCLPVRGDGAS